MMSHAHRYSLVMNATNVTFMSGGANGTNETTRKHVNVKFKIYHNTISTLEATLHFSACGFWITISKKSLSGATRISFFFDRMRRKLRSLLASSVRTILRALDANCDNKAACSADSSAVSVDFRIWPSELTMRIPSTPRWLFRRRIVSSTSLWNTHSAQAQQQKANGQH